RLTLSTTCLFTDTATTQIYPLSLHDALPISAPTIALTHDIDDVDSVFPGDAAINVYRIVQESLNNIVKHSGARAASVTVRREARSEEHTSELQSLTNLVCRLLLEKKKLRHTH